ncbi:MAG: UDP-2,3-diacylglucosamine diphosphatase LpxI [Pirellulales bacterium]
MQHVQASTSNAPIGLVAGWGRYPLIVAEALATQGRPIVGLGVKDHADPRLARLCDSFRWVGMAKLGAAIRFFRRHEVREATMAGKIHKVKLYQPWLLLRHLPDWQALKTFWPHFIGHRADRKDDTLLGTLVDAFARHGIDFRPATDFAPELLVKNGTMTVRRPTAAERADVEFGWRLAKEMGRLDVGQSVAVKNRAVLAVEAIEGTDECIRRAGTLCAAGGFTVVKVAKPQQDMRFDVPTIGLGTLETMVAAGATVLAIEAEKTILLDESAVVEFANRHRLSIVAYDAQAMDAHRAA